MKAMLRYFLTAVMAIVITTAQAQTEKTPSFDGYWAGIITTLDDEPTEIPVILKITNGVAQDVDYDEDTDSFRPAKRTKEFSQTVRYNLSYTWMNKGGVWTETQTYLMSYINDKQLKLVWVRQVNNIQEGEDNDEWFVSGRGDLVKFTESELKKIFKD